MEGSYKYAFVRQQIIDGLRADLYGPESLDAREEMPDSPLGKYFTGRLFPYDYGQNTQSSCGLSCYVETADDTDICITVSWAQYEKTEKDGPYIRRPYSEKYKVDQEKDCDYYPLPTHTGLDMEISITAISQKYRMISVILNNNIKTAGRNSDITPSVIFQVSVKLEDASGRPVFVAENVCRDNAYKDDRFYENHPVYARGLNCAASWSTESYRAKAGDKAVSVETSFIPDCEINKISSSPVILPEHHKGIDLSAYRMSREGRDGMAVKNLKALNESYSEWINFCFSGLDSGNPDKVRCEEAYKRIAAGIDMLKEAEDDTAEEHDAAWQAFVFMNQVMYLQNAIAAYSKRTESKSKAEKESEAEKDFETFRKEKADSLEDYSWKPFQIAFILLNIPGIVNPENTEEREIVDLLYFPTGGGKTEAYLGLIAFTIGYRRLIRNRETDFEKDGGVTAILRYTLRLLTTQQRDRLTKMILAAEIIRENVKDKNGNCLYGNARISLGFWVGSKGTPNKFSEYGKKEQDGGLKCRLEFQTKILGQLDRCPFCGRRFDRGNIVNNEYTNFGDNFKLEFNKADHSLRSIQIICSNPNCYFGPDKSRNIPVYLVDEQIYRECPTVLIATADKFARLPYEADSKRLFGRRGKEAGKDFYPPELIVQDELHLITGNLGSMYGCYETLVEEMCTVRRGDKVIKPKYVACTATVENVENQIRSLYAREHFRRFPPQGKDSGDSFFSRELPLPDRPYDDLAKSDENRVLGFDENFDPGDAEPFREYVGICGNGISAQEMLSRVYAVLLQEFYNLCDNEKYSELRLWEYLDPYYTLIGFFNTLRELGSMVWQLDDPDKVETMIRKVGESMAEDVKPREIRNTKELTSRVDTTELEEILYHLTIRIWNYFTGNEDLDTDADNDDENDDTSLPYDVVLTTNIMAVGLDIDRLGLMVMTGAPRSNSEYIQASSRVGRRFPGLIVTVYNPYRSRDMSYYENFKGFHSQMYHYIEGATATPFSSGVRKRILHAVLIGMIRLQNEEMNSNESASKISTMSDKLKTYIERICERIRCVTGNDVNAMDTELSPFVDSWEEYANGLVYSNVSEEGEHPLMISYQSEKEIPGAKHTLSSMRDVENGIPLFLSFGGSPDGGK